MGFRHKFVLSSALYCSVFAAALAAAPAAQMVQDSPMQTGRDQTAAVRVNEAIFLAYGFGNTYLITTPAGNVIVDTSNVGRAPAAKALLQKENAGPITHIILTHGHGDHTGGVKLWKEPKTEVIAQSDQTEFLNYQERLAGFFSSRNSAQFKFSGAARRALERELRRRAFCYAYVR